MYQNLPMKFFTLGFLLLSLPVLAHRNVYDLMFLPEQGTIFGTSALTFTEGKIWGRAATITESGYRFTQSLGYSLTSRFALTTNINYLYKKSDYRYNINLPSDATYEKGVSDPSLDVKFRLQETKLVIDLLAGAVFETGQTKISNDRKKNNKQGGTSFKAGLQLGQQSSGFQWSLLGQYERFLKSQIDESRSTYGDSTMDANNRYLIRLDGLKNLTENSLMRVFVLSKMIDAYLGNGPVAYDPVTYYEVGPEYQYLFSRDLVLKAGISYSTITSAASPYDTWHLNLSSTYQF